MTVLGAMYNGLTDEAPTTILHSGQIWTKYGIMYQVRRGDITTVLNAMRTAQSEQQKKAALDDSPPRSIPVYDLELRQFVDQKDFASKNFGAPPAPPQPPSPPPPGPAGMPTVRAITSTRSQRPPSGQASTYCSRSGSDSPRPILSPMEITLGWRSQDGTFQYGQFLTLTLRQPTIRFPESVYGWSQTRQSATQSRGHYLPPL